MPITPIVLADEEVRPIHPTPVDIFQTSIVQKATIFTKRALFIYRRI
ncbi:hypothetical protein [Rossellomorea arthrocnemi]|nr:hypothetical protein [Rossellomorea arthrocnemi]